MNLLISNICNLVWDKNYILRVFRTHRNLDGHAQWIQSAGKVFQDGNRHGRRKGRQWGAEAPLDFENFSKKRLFSWCREGKNKFHHFWPPPDDNRTFLNIWQPYISKHNFLLNITVIAWALLQLTFVLIVSATLTFTSYSIFPKLRKINKQICSKLFLSTRYPQ